MKSAERYNIYDLVSFELINKTGISLFQTFNPENKYFRSSNRSKNHFEIVVHNKYLHQFKTISKNNRNWAIDIATYLEKGILNIYSENVGLKNLFSFTILKNIYVRSLVSVQLLKEKATLVHSCAFKINNKTYIFAGRPGVFKTSILMDAIRNYDAEFIGEENCLIHNSKVYPYPLNIDSLSYKIKYFSKEDASHKLQKIMLGINLIKKHKNVNYHIRISKPSNISNLIYLIKGEKFNIKSVELNEILPYLIDNEIQELSIPPTHTLSGINYNYLKEIIEEMDFTIIDDFRDILTQVFRVNLVGVNFYIVTLPQNYNKEYTDNLIANI